MTYQEFQQEVTSLLSEQLSDQATISIQTILKNNGQKLDGLTIQENDINISPTIYLNSFFDAYQTGESVDDIVERIKSIYDENKMSENLDLSFYQDYTLVKDKIIFKLVNKSLNHELLERVPYIEYLDLAIIFCYFYQFDENSMSTILIHNEHLTLWNVSKEELFEMAKINTPTLLQSKIDNMAEILTPFFEKQQDVLRALCVNPMFVLSNTAKLHGASCILYQNLLEQFATELNDDLYVIPSSIHEVLLIPSHYVSSDWEMDDIIQCVNQTELSREEILSNHSYYYSRSQKALSY